MVGQLERSKHGHIPAALDPLGYRGDDVNLYRYVGNNPVNATDPTGLKLVVGGKEMQKGDAEYNKILGAAPFGKDVVQEILDAMIDSKQENKTYTFATTDLLRKVIALRLNIILATDTLAANIKNQTMQFTQVDTALFWLERANKGVAKFWRSHGDYTVPTFGGIPVFLQGLELRDIMKAYEAFDELTKIPKGDILFADCASAVIFAIHLGIRTTLGEKEFVKLIQKRKQLWLINFIDAYKDILTNIDIDPDKALGKKYNHDLIPGDLRVFYNKDFTNKNYKFENVIYLGKGLYFAFPFGQVTLAKLKEELEQYRQKGGAPIVDLGFSRSPILPQ